MPSPRPELVPRPRLIERLNAGLHRKLTCISAPAGFGKTTLVSEWAAALRSGGQRSARVAWLSLDESDNDLTRFLTYLIAALETIEPGVGKGALSALEASGLQSPQPPPMEGILTALINALSSAASNATAPMVLVLDDYHLIDDGAGPRGRGEAGATVHDALTFLLRHLPPSDPVAGGLHLVITTRVDPPLPLARLRARGQLNEVRAADLRFLSAEAAEFLNQTMGLAAMGLKLPAEYIAALERRTEGWIAGLQLAALALQGTSMQGSIDVQGFIQSFAGSHRYVLDYLIEEVLEQQSESLQTFMLRTALLDRLTGSLCDAVTDQSSGQATLEALDRANLFIVPLDAERGWFRYHRLFSDLIRQRLRQTQPQLASTLHIRASEWYEQNGYTDEAIEHALRAEAYERMARLIEEHIDALWGRGEHATLHGWLDRLPAELVSSRPHLCILKAWYLFASGQLDATEQLLRAAVDTERSPTERDPASDLDRDKIRGRIATIRAFLAFYRGDVERIAEYAHRALEHLPEQDLVWRSTATVVLGDAYGLAGELEAAHPVRLQALAANKAVGNTYMILIAALKLAVTLRQQGWFEQSIEVCRRHVEYAQEIGM
jgi:LuxR family maltose regulon positive regulatory protein